MDNRKDNDIKEIDLQYDNWGAEAVLINTEWLGLKAVKKIRIPKKYRIKELDEHLRKTRTIIESRLLHLAKKSGVRTPYLYEIDVNNKTIVMERVEGKSVKEFLNDKKISLKEKIELVKNIGRLVGLLHKNHIIHGDLTTSNIILLNNEIVFIDFGLGKFSKDIEDKGVDFLLMKKCFISTHTEYWRELFFAFQDGYKQTMDNAPTILKRAIRIEARGRHLKEEQVVQDYKLE